MALIRHLNGNKDLFLFKFVDFLTMQQKEIRNKKGQIVDYEPIYGEDGMQKERENYAISYLKSDGEMGELENWSYDCYETNFKYRKNLNENDVKSHHYVISFPDIDMKNGLTLKQAQEFAEEYCKENFKGYQALVCTHGDTDNIHCHIIINSVRDKEIEKQDWMEKCADGVTIKPSQYEAGGKHTNTPKFRQHLMEKIDEMCEKYRLMVDNFSDRSRKTKTQECLNYMHDSILLAMKKAKNKDDLIQILSDEYNIKLKPSKDVIFVMHPDIKKARCIDFIGITPYNLTSDLHYYYDLNPERYLNVHETWSDPARRFVKKV